MSIRAYRINKIELSLSESWNLWHDEKIMRYLQSNGLLVNLNEDGAGYIIIPIFMLENMLKEALYDDDEYGAHRKDCIRKDIEWAKEQRAEYVEYRCY